MQTTLSPLQTLGLDKAPASSISTIRSTAASSQSSSVGVGGTGSAASSKRATTALPPHLQARFVNQSNNITPEANSIVKIEDTDSDIGAGQWSTVASKKRHVREANRSEAPDRQHSTSFSQTNMSKGQPQPDITVDDNKKSRKKGAWVKTEVRRAACLVTLHENTNEQAAFRRLSVGEPIFALELLRT